MKILLFMDAKKENWFTLFLIGCFNYHIVHRLFQYINSIYYREEINVFPNFCSTKSIALVGIFTKAFLVKHYKVLKNNIM